jgi:octaprenyl-diphosphate synthase
MSETTNIMSEGEVFQLVRSGDAGITEEDYLTIIEKKTAFSWRRPAPSGGFWADRAGAGGGAPAFRSPSGMASR